MEIICVVILGVVEEKMVGKQQHGSNTLVMMLKNVIMEKIIMVMNINIMLKDFILEIIYVVKIGVVEEKNGWEATTWFKHTGTDAERCNDGKNHNGYEYKYKKKRNTEIICVVMLLSL